MTDALKINNDIYVSAARGAEMTGYASDYIGQLAREGRVTSEKIGRTLYVHQYELLSYADKKDAHTSSKRGPKTDQDTPLNKSTPGWDKEEIPSVTIPTKLDETQATPLRYKVEKGDVLPQTVKKASTEPIKEDNNSINIHRVREEAPLVRRYSGNSHVEMQTMRPKRAVASNIQRSSGKEAALRNTKKKGSSIVVSMIVFVLLLVLSLSSIFVDVNMVYTQNRGMFEQEASNYEFNTETFFSGVEEIRLWVVNTI